MCWSPVRSFRTPYDKQSRSSFGSRSREDPGLDLHVMTRSAHSAYTRVRARRIFAGGGAGAKTLRRPRGLRIPWRRIGGARRGPDRRTFGARRRPTPARRLGQGSGTGACQAGGCLRGCPGPLVGPVGRPCSSRSASPRILAPRPSGQLPLLGRLHEDRLRWVGAIHVAEGGQLRSGESGQLQCRPTRQVG